jgi:hypothetical protein
MEKGGRDDVRHGDFHNERTPGKDEKV